MRFTSATIAPNKPGVRYGSHLQRALSKGTGVDKTKIEVLEGYSKEGTGFGGKTYGKGHILVCDLNESGGETLSPALDACIARSKEATFIIFSATPARVENAAANINAQAGLSDRVLCCSRQKAMPATLKIGGCASLDDLRERIGVPLPPKQQTAAAVDPIDPGEESEYESIDSEDDSTDEEELAAGAPADANRQPKVSRAERKAAIEDAKVEDANTTPRTGPGGATT